MKTAKTKIKQKRISRAKLLKVCNGDKILTDFLVCAARAFNRNAEARRLNLISTTTGDAMQQYQSEGRVMSSQCPYGKVRDPENPAYMLDNENELAVIRRIVELRGSGLSIKKVTNQINSEGLFNRKGNAWPVSRVHEVIQKHHHTEQK